MMRETDGTYRPELYRPGVILNSPPHCPCRIRVTRVDEGAWTGIFMDPQPPCWIHCFDAGHLWTGFISPDSYWEPALPTLGMLIEALERDSQLEPRGAPDV